ncbi:MAG: LEA14-like dessication related protein [Phycisphaerales bacterium]|jgi:LEA14-like dessication related protein
MTTQARTRRSALWLLSIAAIVLGGCSSTSQPSFEIADATATARTDDGLALLFTIDAANQNPDAMPLRIVRYDLRLNGRRVFSGLRSPEATIPPFGTQRFTLPAVIPADRVPQDATSAEYELSGTVTYIEPGRLYEILFEQDLRVPKASINGAGTIRFDD